MPWSQPHLASFSRFWFSGLLLVLITGLSCRTLSRADLAHSGEEEPTRFTWAFPEKLAEFLNSPEGRDLSLRSAYGQWLIKLKEQSAETREPARLSRLQNDQALCLFRLRRAAAGFNRLKKAVNTDPVNRASLANFHHVLTRGEGIPDLNREKREFYTFILRQRDKIYKLPLRGEIARDFWQRGMARETETWLERAFTPEERKNLPLELEILRGRLSESRGENFQARQSFDRVVREERGKTDTGRRNRGRALFRLGLLEQSDGQFSKASYYYLAALKEDPGIWEAWYRLAWMSSQKGDYGWMEIYLDRGEEQAPAWEAARFQVYRLRYQLRLNAPDKAREILARIPANTEYYRRAERYVKEYERRTREKALSRVNYRISRRRGVAEENPLFRDEIYRQTFGDKAPRPKAAERALRENPPEEMDDE